jgi:20S proteasome alpha/beta subunit
MFLQYLGVSLLFLTIHVIVWTSFVVPSATAERYNPYSYDLTVAQFTPDGRLLQVEYACTAAEYSSPVVLIRVEDAANDDSLVLVVTTRVAQRTQERILVLDNNNNNCNTVVVFSGLVSDSFALLRKARKARREQQRTWGFASTKQVARSIADACQWHTFGGGVRPYGASSVVVGLHHDTIAVFHTDASGVMHQLLAHATTTAATVLGGTKRARGGSTNAALLRTLNALDVSSSSSSLADVLPKVARIVCDETNKSNKQSNKNNHDDNTDETCLEIAVISRERGVYKLSQEQVDKLLAKTL